MGRDGRLILFLSLIILEQGMDLIILCCKECVVMTLFWSLCMIALHLFSELF